MKQQTISQAQTQTMPTPLSRGGILQRKCACGQHTVAGGECAECRKRRLQRKASNHAEPEAVPSIVHEVLRSPGQPLDANTRSFMEERFVHNFSEVQTHTIKLQTAAFGMAIGPVNDHCEREANRVADNVMRAAPPCTLSMKAATPDFSQVRVHTDAKAAESAEAMNALAYTVGHDVVFGSGQYAPQSNAGSRLLAHELAHVLQQQSSAVPVTLQRQAGSSSNRQRGLQLRRSVLRSPCACLVFIHNNERNARRAVEHLHGNCHYNIAIMMPDRGGRRIPAVGVTRAQTVQRGGKLFVDGIEVKCGRTACTVDPNELFSPSVQRRCTSDEASCREYIAQNNDFTAQQMQFFLTIKDCSNNFSIPTVALHNNALEDTSSFRGSTTPSSRRRLRGDFSRNTAQGPGSISDLRTRLGPNRGLLTRSKTTNIFRWCNLPEIGRCHIGDPDNPDHVIWVTTTQDFETLQRQDVNVVLQRALNTAAGAGSESETDLSTLFLRLGSNARFINIETPERPRNRATRARDTLFIQQMLEHVGLDCCEPIGDFPTPSRTELYA